MSVRQWRCILADGSVAFMLRDPSWMEAQSLTEFSEWAADCVEIGKTTGDDGYDLTGAAEVYRMAKRASPERMRDPDWSKRLFALFASRGMLTAAGYRGDFSVEPVE
jgi:hypothetical protein